MALSRNDKQSPHSSPRPTRRSATPNVCTAPLGGQNNDIYANQSQSQQQQQQQHSSQSAVLTSAHSLHSINGNNTSNNSFGNNKATNISSKTTSSTSLQPTISNTNLNRMSAPLMPTSSSPSTAMSQYQQIAINKVLNKAQSADMNEVLQLSTQDPVAPPLPPRKSSPVVDSSVNRLLKPHTNSSVTSASSLVNLSSNANMSTMLSRSSENITCCDFEVPKAAAPPIPKQNIINTNFIDTVADEFKNISFSMIDDNCDKVIVGPAETISGIIDTRPLEARKPIVPINNCVYDKTISTPNGSNNLYHLKISSSNHSSSWQQQHQQQPQNMQVLNISRHQIYPVVTLQSVTANSASPVTQTTPQHGMEYVKLSTTSSTTTSSTPMTKIDVPTISNKNFGKGSGNRVSGESSQDQQTPLLYENVTINNKDCNVPYENINLEYIARLMNEGYSKENVITALGISRNNIEMACDILHEFVSKSDV